jgi:uncharacterized membrane protein (DUF2068 family)
MASDPKVGPETLKRAPTLYIIIVLKLIKGLFLVGLAYMAYALSDNDLPADYQSLLHWMNHWMKLNPERKFWTDIAAQVGSLTEARMVHVAVGTFIYSMFSLVEGVGLMFRISWAGWLSIGESAFFIPIEIGELVHVRFTWLVFGILVANIFMVWYLFQNRDRLFRHHH